MNTRRKIIGALGEPSDSVQWLKDYIVEKRQDNILKKK